MGLTCAKADVKTQAPLEETEDAQDRSDELLERWRSGELAHLQRVYRSHARPPQHLDRDGFVEALDLQEHAHADTLYELFGSGSCRDFCRTLAWWCRGDASERRSFLFCWFAISSTAEKDALVAGDASSTELPKNMLGALCVLLETPPPYHLCAKGTISWRKFDGWARTLSDEQVWSCLPLAIVSQPDTERAMVLETWQKGSPGDVYHVIPRRWWDAWCSYVGWSNLAPPPPGALVTVKPAGATSGVRPRDVDASSLESDRDGALRAKVDVACIPEAVWRLFEQWYGGGPIFPRRLQDDGMLDLYPISVFIDACDENGRPRNAFTARRADRKETIAAFARRLSSTSARLYATSPTGWRRLTPSSRCDEVLEAGSTYLLETKTDGVWPRASSRYVVGDRVSARDHTERWRSGKVIAVSETRGVKIRFDEYSSKWDEWLTSDRLRREDVDIDDVSLSEDEERPSLLKGAVSSLRRVLGSNDDEEEETRRLPATGLANLGNTCFLNAAVQCLSHAPILRAYCLSDMYVQDINRTSRLGSQGRVVEAFADLLRQLHSSQVCVRPEGFKKVLGKCKPQFAGSEQQDSQEFLTVRTRRPSST
jgi:hypothetical protein